MNLLFIMVTIEVSLIFKNDVGWLMLGSTSANLLFCPRRMIALPPGNRSPFDSQYLSSRSSNNGLPIHNSMFYLHLLAIHAFLVNFY